MSTEPVHPGYLVYFLGVAVLSLLITGYILLAAFGRDTTGYVLLIGGPAMTSVIGVVLNNRVSAVAVQVSDVQAAAAALTDDELPAVHRHLQIQDLALGEIAMAVQPAEPAPAPAPPTAGAPRSPIPSARDARPAEAELRRPVWP